MPSRAASCVSYTALAIEREHIVYSSLLPLAGALLGGREPMPSRLVPGCIAMPFTSRVHAVASSPRRAHPVKSCKLSSTTLAIEREHIVYSSLLPLAGALLGGREPMLSRLVRGCIAMPFTACVYAVASSPRRLAH